MPQTDVQKYDFGGYATKYNEKCSDGRVILPGAFSEMDGKRVPLVWQHARDEVKNILGHAWLEERSDGTYVRTKFNESEAASHAKLLVEHGDIDSLSIYANSLVEKSKKVSHGVIREVALVVSGANPGAKIDNVAMAHGDDPDDLFELDDEAIIYTGLSIEFNEDETDEEVIVHADDSDDPTVGEVIDTLTEEQKTAVYAIIGKLIEDEEISQSSESDEDDELTHNEEGDVQMPDNETQNVFDAAGNVSVARAPQLGQEDFNRIVHTAQQVGSLRAAFQADEVGMAFLEHHTTYGVGSDRANFEYLLPDARNLTKTPTWIARRMEWVSGVITGTKHVPFSRLKSLHADITADEARARGYVTGNLKVEEVFPLLRRITTPHTIYKKQKLDRDDIIDVTDFDIVSWLKSEMRVMLDEEIARAILVGDGRDPVTEVDDHIPTDNIRPIWGDAAVYTYHKQVASTRTTVELIDDMITAREEYRGSGSPKLYLAPSFLTAMLLLKDADERRLYRSEAELASELRVSGIVEVPVMDGLQRTDTVDYNLMAIICNLRDYTIGADKGGAVAFFDDFDIDYNQFKYLIETRASGALTVPKSALVLEQAVI